MILVSGSVFFNPNNQSQIIVRDFFYPKPGPDAFFWAGESEPACSEDSITKTINYLLRPGHLASLSSSLLTSSSFISIFQVGITTTQTSRYCRPMTATREISFSLFLLGLPPGHLSQGDITA